MPKHTLSIKNKIMFYFFIVSVVPIMALGMIAFNIANKSIKAKIDATMESNIKLVGTNVVDRLKSVEQKIDFLFSDEMFSVAVAELDLSKSNEGTFIDYKKVQKNLSTYFLNENHLVSCIIFGVEKGIYTYKNEIMYDVSSDFENEWFNDTLSIEGMLNWIGMRKITDIYEEEYKLVAFSRMFKDIANYSPLKGIAVLYLAYDSKMFDEIYSMIDMVTGNSLFILDNNNQIISSNSTTEFDELVDNDIFKEDLRRGNKGTKPQKYNGDLSLIYRYNIPENGWKVINIVPYSYVTEQIRNIAFLTIGLVLFSIVLLNLVSFYLSTKITTPLFELNNAMLQVEKGNFSVNIGITSNDEIGQMEKSFNNMTKNLKYYFDKIIKLEEEKKKIELQTLYYQMNPHFIFNTLGSIRIISILSQAENVTKALDAFIRMIRNVQKNIGTKITLGEELENVGAFVYINKIRYGNNLNLKMDINEELLTLMIPNCILQPIVENSIFHGFREHNHNGIIEIKAAIANNNLCLEVNDNGSGISEKKIKEIFDLSNKSSFLHIGLRNIQDRLVLSFGNEYGINIEKSELGGVKVLIRVPIIRREGQDV